MPISLMKKRGKNFEVGSAMDDFINAHLDLGCHQVVPMLVFGNDQRCKFLGSHCHIVS